MLHLLLWLDGCMLTKMGKCVVLTFRSSYMKVYQLVSCQMTFLYIPSLMGLWLILYHSSTLGNFQTMLPLVLLISMLKSQAQIQLQVALRAVALSIQTLNQDIVHPAVEMATAASSQHHHLMQLTVTSQIGCRYFVVLICKLLNSLKYVFSWDSSEFILLW